MPKYKTHLFAGLLTYSAIMLFFTNFLTFNNHSIIYLLSCLLGSLFPDIDTKSKIQKIIYWILFIVLIILALNKQWYYISSLGIILLIPIISNHRGLTHKTWFIILLPLIIPIFVYNFDKKLLKDAFFCYIFFVLGGISHIILDFGFKKTFFRK